VPCVKMWASNGVDELLIFALRPITVALCRT
jgi:hypothetical protein